MTPDQKGALEAITGFKYAYSGVGWCKAVPVETVQQRWLSRPPLKPVELEVRRLSRSDLASHDAKPKLRDVFLSRLYNIIPEHSPYLDLCDGPWLPLEKDSHLVVLDEIISQSMKEMEADQKEHLELIQAGLLKPLGIDSLDDPNASDPVVKQAIDAYFNRDGVYYDRDGRARGVFHDYRHLKELFLERLFDLRSVVFFVNQEVPAVIGVDGEVVGLFWMN